MKQFLIMLCLMFSPIMYGQSNASTTIEEIKEIQRLEASENFRAAYELTLRLMNSTSSQIRAGEVVASITSQLNKVWDEKIVTTTSSYDRSFTPFGWFQFRLGPLVHSKIDITKLILRNPEETSEFPEKVNRDLEKLKKQLIDYVNQNAESLVNLKMLSIKAVQYLVLSMNQGAVYSSSDLEVIEQVSLGIAFLGEHNISTCVTTNFTDSSSSHEIIDTSVLGFILRTFLPSLRPSMKVSTQNFAHTVKQCDSTTNKIEFNVRDEKKVLLVSFTQLDHELVQWLKFGYAKVSFSQKEDIQFPTFGNPYYR